MSHHKTTKDDAIYHMAASGIAAIVNFPLWRASAIAQSGFKLEGSNVLVRYYKAVVQPPFRGLAATMFGMTWARAAIFFGSDMGKNFMIENGSNAALAQTLPPFVLGTLVQIANQPIVRATITIQDPKSTLNNTVEALVHIFKTRGVAGLWHGTNAAVLKTVPKYICAVAVKDYMEDALPLADPQNKAAVLTRSAIKSVAAGVAGAALTNPLDVIRNEMFKTDLSLTKTFQKVMKEEGWSFMARGMASNVTAVAVPIAMTIFLTDVLISQKKSS
eukprot:gene4180-2979_t